MHAIHSYSQQENLSFHEIDRLARKVDILGVRSSDDLVQFLEASIDHKQAHRNILLARAFLIIQCEARNYHNIEASNDLRLVMSRQPVHGFRLLCQKANIQCNVIKGLGKTRKYKPGYSSEVCLVKGSWCAIKSNENWHLVHPQWAISSTYGFAPVGEIIEVDGRSGMVPHAQTNEMQLNAFNDFWFCTNPDIFIHHCYPDDSAWQLINKPVESVHDFLMLPFLQQGYFQAGLQLLTEQSYVLKSKKGQCIITFTADKSMLKCLELSYTLSILEGDKSKVQWNEMSQLVMVVASTEMYTVKVSLPVEGVYSLELLVIAEDVVTNMSCAEFKIVCEEACKHCKKVPLDVGIEGYGFGNEARKAGLKNPSVKTPVVVLKPNEDDLALASDAIEETGTLDFQIDSDVVDEMEYTSNIVGDTTGARTEAYVDKDIGKLTVVVEVNKKGDYGLSVKARGNQEENFKTVLNFMLTNDSNDSEMYIEHDRAAKQRKREIAKQRKTEEKMRTIKELTEEIKKLRESILSYRNS